MNTRILLTLPDAQIHSLKVIGNQKKKPRTEIIREAIQQYIGSRFPRYEISRSLEKTDGLDYQEGLRSEW